ncbi:hypothetical protein [Cyanobium sp. ATX 6F1]|uniref:hypothetical protein n=1 Tax=unclassified Cyanobium TaxID=2627006 RepID=UPI0020CBB9C1|nr:hypothetical protein [Cyanobium sp. ATX 6F1]MCP9915248.1 hypothetical protein [Cyanobium sp. ATX 6F1]
MSDLDKDKPDKPGKPVIKPTKPGRPWAPPQPEVEGTDPTVPTAPTPDAPPEEPTDPTTPSDPTVPLELTDTDPVLELPPEGMLRISKSGRHDQFVYPVHSDRWAAEGWKVHPPVNVDPSAGVEDRAEPEVPELPVDPVVPEVPELPPVETLPGALPDAVEPVVPEVPPADATDFASMTKAQIVAEVEATYGVALDPSQTKSELVEQAETLATEPTPQPVPGLDAPSTELDTSIPADLLG